MSSDETTPLVKVDKLRERLNAIRDVLDDAEDREPQDGKPRWRQSGGDQEAIEALRIYREARDIRSSGQEIIDQAVRLMADAEKYFEDKYSGAKGSKKHRKYLVTEFTVVEAEDINEAKALVAELEGEVLAVEADAYENGRVGNFGALHRLVQEMQAAHVVMTPEDIRCRIEESLEGDGDESDYHGLDVDRLVEEAMESWAWRKGFSGDPMMGPAWGLVDDALWDATKRLKGRE